MNQHAASPVPFVLFDLSSPDGWIDAHAATSAALSAASFAHPGCSRAEIRMNLATGEMFAIAEQPRRARALPATLPLPGDCSGDKAFAEAMLCPNDEALSLAKILREIATALMASSGGSPTFASGINPTLGLGCSERWDENFSDGLGRGEAGCASFDQACADCSGRFGSAAIEAAKSGAKFCSGDAKEACLRALSEMEADRVELSCSEPVRASNAHRTRL